MVMMALYNPLAVSEAPKALRRFLLCRISLTTIIRVRSKLSATEIEKDGIPAVGLETKLLGCDVW
jgi:hypothetical protein